MKTLDEVIKALEECTADDAIESEGAYLATDALFYLKEYRKQKDLVGFLHAHIQAIEEDYQELRNTSQELRNAEKYPNILFRPEGMYCCVCGSRLDQDPEEEK